MKTTIKKNKNFFSKKQLYHSIIGIGVIVLVILMSGGGSDDPAVLVMQYLTLDEFV
jgi:hypothetical protein